MQKISKEKKLDRIHDAVMSLIERREANDISIYDISKECGIATSTVYHHYPNIEYLFQSLMKDVFTDFDSILDNCIKPNEIHHWSDINRMIESGYVKYYQDNAIAQKLILSRHTFTSINHSDVENDFALGKRVEHIYRRYFNIPELPENINIFAIALQTADKVYSLSYREHGCIRSDMAEEAVKLTQAYLGLYLPNQMQRIA